jgi:type IV secretory pathway TraG/TraD family ATPase VirD4
MRTERPALLLDEAAALGRIQPIEDGVGYLAAYMNMIMVRQDLDQLERTCSRARLIGRRQSVNPTYVFCVRSN